MRLDRFLTLYFFHPLRRILRRSSGTRISILMYHSVSDRDADVSHPYYQTNTRPEVFARHMQFLADNNYKVISLSDAVSLLSGSSPSSLVTQATNQPVTSSKYCVLTWDDGYRDFHDYAWPILKKHGFTATMFLPTGFMENERKALNGKDCLTWGEVKTLATNGTAFGAHTVSHVQLYALDRRNIAKELQNSKKEIEEKLGSKVNHYSYAYAFPEQDTDFVQYLEQSLRQAGYTCAVSTRIGTVGLGDNPYILKRIPVNSHDDEDLLRAKLAGAYDWLNRIQVIKKRVKFAG
jgi:peptidoglycan/xylan/chitin deacetylase (PgdA/CDA1 family)